MGAYVLRRLLATIPVMAVVAVFVFFLLRLAPGDPAAIIAGEDATAEAIAAVRAKLGLDRRSPSPSRRSSSPCASPCRSACWPPGRRGARPTAS
jgi:ABC-type microcin C transport system permease subunit YejB